MEDILARAGKVAEAAEVFMVSADETQVQFEANRLKRVQTRQSRTLALRVVRQGRVGYATTTGPGSREELVDMAVETARFGMKAGFEFPPAQPWPDVGVFDPDAGSVPIESMVKLGERLVAAVTRHTPGIVCEAGVTRDAVSLRIINSRGADISYRKTIFSLGIDGSLIRGMDMLFVGDSDSSCHPITQPDAIVGQVLRQLELARDLASVPGRELPIVFTPHGVASALVPSLIAAFNGKTVLQGASPVGSRLGQPVFDSRLWLWDDPLAAFRPSSRPADDEGVPSQRTPLIEGGVVSHFFYDLQTAAQAGTRSTGNGGRGYGLPAPAPSAFVIAPGSATLDEMVGDIKEGLVIEQLMGAEQGNILGGDFSGNVLLGYKVESGKIVGRVKNTMVSGNVYEVLKEIVLGSEVRWVDGFLHTPPIFCPKLSVASK